MRLQFDAVVEFHVRDLMLPADCGYRTQLRHEIVRSYRKNYAHAAIRLYRGGIEVEPWANTEIVESAIGAHLATKANLIQTKEECRDSRNVPPT